MQIVGWLGFVFIQLCYLPQLIRSFRTRDVSGVSLGTWVLLWFGLVCYFLYGLYIRDVVFSAGNGAGAVLTSLQIALILKYRNRPSATG